MSDLIKDVTVSNMVIEKEYSCARGEDNWFLTTALGIEFKDVVLYTTPHHMLFSTDKWPGVDTRIYFILGQTGTSTTISRIHQEKFDALSKYMTRDTMRTNRM